MWNCSNNRARIPLGRGPLRRRARVVSLPGPSAGSAATWTVASFWAVPRCVTIGKVFVWALAVRAAPRQAGQDQSHAAARHYLRGKSSYGHWGCRTALLSPCMGTVKALGTPAEPLRPLQRSAGTGGSGTWHGPRPRTLIGYSTDSPTTGCSGLASLAAELGIVRLPATSHGP